MIPGDPHRTLMYEEGGGGVGGGMGGEKTNTGMGGGERGMLCM